MNTIAIAGGRSCIVLGTTAQFGHFGYLHFIVQCISASVFAFYVYSFEQFYIYNRGGGKLKSKNSKTQSP